MQDDLEARIDKIIPLTEEYYKLLIENGGAHKRYRLREILAIINEAHRPLEGRFEEARDVYRRRPCGMGYNFVIDHPDKAMEKMLNQRLNDIEEDRGLLFKLDASNYRDVDEGYPPGHIYWSIKDEK